MSDRLPGALIDALRALTLWAQTCKIPMVVVGGVAASLLGRPRLTRDIDALVTVPDERWSSILDAASAFAMQPRIAGAIEFAHRSRVLLLRHEPSQIDIDVMFGALAFEQMAVSTAVSRIIADFEIPLPRVEDLLIMKAIAHRPRDLTDIEGLLATNTGIDVAAVRKWVREFSVAATMPDLIVDFDKLVAKAAANK